MGCFYSRPDCECDNSCNNCEEEKCNENCKCKNCKCPNKKKCQRGKDCKCEDCKCSTRKPNQFRNCQKCDGLMDKNDFIMYFGFCENCRKDL